MMSLLTFVLFYVLVFVRAVPLAKRIVVSPHITNPTASTIWNVGNQVTVTWDTSSIPPPGNFTGRLLLGFITPGSENLNVDNPLAQNFPLSAGSMTITVPSVPNGSNYIVVLFGDSGNASPQFTITGGSGTTPTPSPTSTPTLTTPSTPPSSPPSPQAPAPAPNSPSPSTPAPVPSTSTSTPASPNPTTPALPVVYPSSSDTTSTTSTTGTTNPSSSNTPAAKSSTSNSALPALHACGARAMFLCAAAAAMSLLVVL